MNRTLYLSIVMMQLLCVSCGSGKTNATAESTDTIALVKAPVFNADSAYAYTDAQCAFGPRVMNSTAHDKCGDYIVKKFRQYGAHITEQRTEVTGYDGKTLHCRNIIASFSPEKKERVMICGHWDSRPWADNDPDSTKHHTPVMAANDAASDVAVMIEIARLIQIQKPTVGVDLICFDAEDYGTPQWSKQPDDESTWCLGSTYWAQNMHVANYSPRFGILMDMVGGQGASFAQESLSKQLAPEVVKNVWDIAEQVGWGSYFPKTEGGAVTDDHLPVNRIAKIPCIDIIPYYGNNPQSSFGPTWHTTSDDMAHIDRNTLRAVGQTVTQVIYNEK
jgi:hypothetical protein